MLFNLIAANQFTVFESMTVSVCNEAIASFVSAQSWDELLVFAAESATEEVLINLGV